MRTNHDCHRGDGWSKRAPRLGPRPTERGMARMSSSSSASFLGGQYYGKRRKAAAKKLGITAATLDKIVAERRVRRSAQTGPETLLPHWDVEPWHEPVASDQLLSAIVERIRAHVVMNQDAAVAVALWVAFSWVHEKAAVHSPLLLVTSAEPNSGKSTLLGVIGFLARRSLPSVSITGPALFHSIVKWCPTFVIDEADTALVNNDDLKEVINSGWTRGQGAVRCDVDTQEPRWFSTFAPKAIGMKGRRLPDTTLSRAIIVEMKRKSPSEAAQDLRHIDDAGLARLRRQLHRWSIDNEAALADALPEMLPGFRNRVAANWNLLLAIAESAGLPWKRAAWQAATAIERVREGFDASLGLELIRNIRSAFDEAGNPACLSSVDLLARLTANPEWPWAKAQNGNPLDQRGLANRLRDYGVRPEVVHPTRDVSPRGYKLAAFRDVFERYLQGDSENLTARTHAINNDGGFHAHGDVHATRFACGSEIVQNVNKINGACGRADRKPEKAP